MKRSFYKSIIGGFCSLAWFCPVAQADSIQFLQVTGNVAQITTQDPVDQHADCVTSENTRKWTINLSTDEGRAAYSLAVSAAQLGLDIQVTPSGDCADLVGVERLNNLVVTN